MGTELILELLLLSLLLLLSTSHSYSELSGDGGTTTQRVVTLTFPLLQRDFTSHKSVSFFFIAGCTTLSTVDTVGNVESFDLLDCILIDFLLSSTTKINELRILFFPNDDVHPSNCNALIKCLYFFMSYKLYKILVSFCSCCLYLK